MPPSTTTTLFPRRLSGAFGASMRVAGRHPSSAARMLDVGTLDFSVILRRKPRWPFALSRL